MTNTGEEEKCHDCGEVQRVPRGDECWYCGYRFIPAPVVPSLVLKTPMEATGWLGGDGYRVVDARTDEGFVEPVPSPSQDAEGDVPIEVQRARTALTLRVMDYAANGGDERFRLYQQARGAVESAIRAPYEERLNAAYRERAQMAVALARLFPSWVNIDPDEPGWPVLYVQLPTGQASWHFSPADRALLDGITVGGPAWDGHTTEEKYARLAALESLGGRS